MLECTAASGEVCENAVNEFNHLLFIVGVIVALGIAKILTGVEEIIQQRKRIKVYWVLIAWMLILFILQVQTWYIHYTWDTESLGKNFFAYLTSLVFPVILYVASCLIAPRIPEDTEFSLRKYYYEQHRWFFGLSVLGVAYAAIHTPIATGDGFFEVENLIYLAALPLLTTLMVIKDSKTHGALTIIVAGLLIAFIALVALDLG